MSRLLALILILGPATLTLAACPKECLDPSFCTRTCDCTDTQRNRVVECPMSFKCELEGESGYCEDKFNDLTCPEICSAYAANNLCGSRVCETEYDCEVHVLCEQRDPMSGALLNQFDCDRIFACDVEVGACEAAFAVSQTEHCQACLAASGGVTAQSIQ